LGAAEGGAAFVGLLGFAVDGFEVGDGFGALVAAG